MSAAPAESPLPSLPKEVPAPREVGESAWIEVIQRMDQVYEDLVGSQVALEQKNAALEESQQFIESVLGSMSDLLLVLGRDGCIEEVNASLLAFTGRTADELRGTAAALLFEGEESQRRAARAFGDPGQEVRDLELPMHGKQGAALEVSLNGTPRLGAQKRLLGMVVTARPVGELRRAYGELRRAHEELKEAQQRLLQAEKMASLGRLVAGVAHELNNPISFVLGNVHALGRYSERLSKYLSALHQGSGPSELERLRRELRVDKILGDLRQLIDGTVEGAERTRDIVDALKRFSATERGELLPVNLVAVVEQALRWVGPASPAGMQVELQLPASLPVLGSQGQLQQVLLNLIENARDATLGRQGPRLSIRGRIEAGQAVLELHDNGPGIGPQHLPQIFEPFFTTKPVGKGTGLGLAIVYGIVERHLGSITAENHPEGGALFRVRIPVASARQA
jgi:two-component system, NtrC family, sensor histidine kinase HupT/HoxJ